jgi:mannosyltransferase OCH1-like enzyme
MITYNLFIKKYINNNITIPKYIYKTSNYSFNNMPTEMYDAFLTSLSNSPMYKIVYLDDNDCDNFIKTYYPEYYNGYYNIIPGAYKADIFRLLILYKFGGIYSDVGQVFIENINNIINPENDLVIVGTNGYEIFNAFIAAKPNNSIIKKMIDIVMHNVNNRLYCENLLDITGPSAIGKAFNLFFEKDEKSIIDSGDIILNNYKIKIHLLQIENEDYYNNGYIIDSNNNKLIKSKFENYFNVMYNNNVHYSIIYHRKKVYR